MSNVIIPKLHIPRGENQMKKKVAIVTIQSLNYGNRLQNYALQKALLKRDVNVTTLLRKKEKTKFKIKLKDYLRVLRNQTKHDKFAIFDRKINWSRKPLTIKSINDDWNSQFDIFIAGSDQIWNPNFEFVDDAEYLSFAVKGKSFAYAASFGVSDLLVSDEKRSRIKALLENFALISVREQSASDIVEELIGQRPPVVLDPTMLLNKEEWESEECMPLGMKSGRKYVLLYLLGGQNEVISNVINHVGKNYEVIDVLDKGRDGKENAFGPSEFIWLVHNAQCVITDSFHGSVFSILMHTPFINVNRNLKVSDGDMGTRLDSLLNMFSMQHCKYIGANTPYEAIINTNFLSAEDILILKREEANKFIDEILRY
jgi:hypothetical protein